MKKMYAILITVVSLMLFFSSCSDDSTNTPDDTNTENKYFPTNVGSEWTYINYELDDEGNKDTDTEYNTKIVVTGTEQKDAKESYIYQTQDLDGNKIDDNQYYYTTNSKIYWYSDLIPEMDFSLPLDYNFAWHKIVDANGSAWVLRNDPIEDLSFDVPGIGSVSLNGAFTISVTKMENENVTFGTNMDQSINSSIYNLSYTYDGESTSDLGTHPTKFTKNYMRYFAEDIGLIKYTDEPFTIKVDITGFGTWIDAFKSGGEEQVLLEYNIAD
ncbi:hypothetical protein ACFLSQ_06295 [Bacteroidota bacterium]